MKIEKLLLELENLCEKKGYTIRKERGGFRGDQCVFEGDKLIVLNKTRPVETQTAILARVIKHIGDDDLFIKPAVRKELKEIWVRIDRFEDMDKQTKSE